MWESTPPSWGNLNYEYKLGRELTKSSPEGKGLGVFVDEKGIGTGWPIRSLPTQAIFWFYKKQLWMRCAKHQLKQIISYKLTPHMKSMSKSLFWWATTPLQNSCEWGVQPTDKCRLFLTSCVLLLCIIISIIMTA